MNIWRQHGCRWFLILLVAGIVRQSTPRARAQEAGWLHLNGLPEPSVGLEVDDSWENNRIAGANSTYDHLFITPLVGLKTSGSIYHPDLLTFDLDGAMGWGWDSATSSGSGSSQTLNGNQNVNRYLAQINLLEAKPYNAGFFAAQDHTYQDYGSFDTFTVDSTRYGGRINEVTKTLNLNADVGYRNEKDTGFTGDTEISETYLNFVGIQKRQFGQTTLTYHINQYDTTLNSSNSPSSSVNSLNQSVGVSDSETFGQRKQITAAAGASYSQAEYTGQRLDTVNANGNVTINHSPKLDSYLMFNFDNYRLNPATANSLQGSYTVRHQLYESLSSTPDVHGSYQENTSPTGDSSTSRYGVGLSENYTKRVGSWAHLTVGVAGDVDHEDDQSSGSVATTIDESHQLALNQSPVYLNNPNVIASSIQVMAGNNILLVEGADYQVVLSGALTRIQLTVPASSTVLSLLGGNINNSLPVLVNYQSDSLNNAAYELYTASAQFRLDMFGKYGLYARWNWAGNNAPAGTAVQSLTDLVLGADYNRKWFRAGVEYENYDCNFSQYQAGRCFQNFNFHLNEKSSLSLNFNESLYRYSDGGTQEQFLFFSRYSIQLFTSLAWYVEAGASSQNVLGSETLQGVARTGVSWSRGKLSLRTGYEYNDQTTSSGTWSQELVKSRFYLNMKRTF